MGRLLICVFVELFLLECCRIWFRFTLLCYVLSINERLNTKAMATTCTRWLFFNFWLLHWIACFVSLLINMVYVLYHTRAKTAWISFNAIHYQGGTWVFCFSSSLCNVKNCSNLQIFKINFILSICILSSKTNIMFINIGC